MIPTWHFSSSKCPPDISQLHVTAPCPVSGCPLEGDPSEGRRPLLHPSLWGAGSAPGPSALCSSSGPPWAGLQPRLLFPRSLWNRRASFVVGRCCRRMSLVPGFVPSTSEHLGVCEHLNVFILQLEVPSSLVQKTIVSRNLQMSAIVETCVCRSFQNLRASLVAQTAKNPPAMPDTWLQSLDREDPLQKGMAAPSKNACLEIPMNRGYSEGQGSLVSQRVRHDLVTE